VRARERGIVARMPAAGSLVLSSEQLLRAVVELSPAGLGVVARDGTFLMSSSNPELVGMNAFVLFPPELESVKQLRAVMAGAELRWIDGRGGASYEVVGRPIRDDAGEVLGALLVSTVITERLAAEEHLVDSEARMRHIVDSNMLAIMFWDESGTVWDANDAFLQLFGYERDDVAAHRIKTQDINLPAVAADEIARGEVIARGWCTPYQKHMLHSSGARVPVLVGGSRFERSRNAGVAFMLDLTEQHRREREREELQSKLLQVQKLESLGLLAGGIAHDFNNLLTAIIGGAATALLSLAPEHPARSDIDLVMDAARRAADLTRQMLAYSGRGHFQIRPVDLSVMVKELARLLETTISKKAQLRLELASGLPAIQADATQLQQVIMNLVINAGEAIGDETGTILVTSGVQDVDAQYAGELFAAEQLAPGRYVFLEVHDSGVGMDDETRARIFDPFFTTKFTGRGLGLAAVLGIIRAHKGAIRVYSTPGRGSAFKIYFPASDDVPAEVAAPKLDFRGDGLVLVVDDDPAVRGVARRMLSHFGFTVLLAENGAEGLELFRAHAGELALVLLDMTMPVMNGEEAFRGMRAIRSDVPVLLTSGYNEIDATRRFTGKGLTAFLQKPFTPTELIGKLKSILPASDG
jgi:two-component system, cell cycle sensor histidine kinase and response regulator CckA